MKKISADDVQKIMKEQPKTIIINVLSEKSFKKEHVPRSINIPVEDENFVEQVQRKVPNKNETIVVYCASHQCPASTEAAELLEKNGYTNVLDFKGGMQEWIKEKNEVETSPEFTKGAS